MADQVGSLMTGKQADLVVISLTDSAFDPVEDPIVAAVLGGSPNASQLLWWAANSAT